MTLRSDRFGLSVALCTPFNADRSIDLARLVAHGRQSLADGCRSLTVFGTTGEGASLGLNERNRALGALAGAGVDPATQLVVGIAAAKKRLARGPRIKTKITRGAARLKTRSLAELKRLEKQTPRAGH